MKKLLVGIPLVVLGALALAWTNPHRGRAFATPAQCVEAYFQSIKDADAAGHLGCLADDLRQGHTDPAALAHELRTRGRDLRGWILFAEEPLPDRGVAISVDEQRSTGRRRHKLVVRPAGTSWQVARIDAARDLPSDIAYGTHVSQVAPTARELSRSTDDE